MALLTAEERVGTTLAEKYRVVRVLGEGGMGVVFEALDVRFDRRVAIKFLHAQFARHPDVVRRFFNEAKAAAALPGDHVVAVLDFDTDKLDGSHYIVLEFLDGESLSELLLRGPLAPHEALCALGPVMEVLEQAHSRGIVHRDLKPDNIFLARNWKGSVVPKLLDFGVAKLMATSMPSQTSSGTIVGTPAYMGPEQAQAGEQGPWSDVWSMGVIWYEALSGKLHHDFDANEPLAGVIIKVIMSDPRPLADVAGHLDPALCAAVDAALRRDRAKRTSSMAEFHAALAAAIGTEAAPAAPALPMRLTQGEGSVSASSSVVAAGSVPGLSRPRFGGFYTVGAVALAGLVGVAWMVSGEPVAPAVSEGEVSPAGQAGAMSSSPSGGTGSVASTPGPTLTGAAETGTLPTGTLPTDTLATGTLPTGELPLGALLPEGAGLVAQGMGEDAGGPRAARVGASGVGGDERGRRPTGGASATTGVPTAADVRVSAIAPAAEVTSSASGAPVVPAAPATEPLVEARPRAETQVAPPREPRPEVTAPVTMAPAAARIETGTNGVGIIE